MKWLLTIIAGASLAGVIDASAITTTQGFGTIPGTTQAQNPYSGSGIPINTSEYVQINGLGDDTLVIAMAATQHGSSNPAPGNNGAGTYFVNSGLVNSRSTWNFDFYGNSKLGLLNNYVFSLTETANGQTFSFNPTLIPDDVGAPNSFGNSESLDFAQYGVPILYNPNANDTYIFDLTVSSVTGAPIADDRITVITNSVPDTASTALLLGASFIGLAGMSFMMKRRTIRSAA
jgi:hypothetical protein